MTSDARDSLFMYGEGLRPSDRSCCIFFSDRDNTYPSWLRLIDQFPYGATLEQILQQLNQLNQVRFYCDNQGWCLAFPSVHERMQFELSWL